MTVFAAPNFVSLCNNLFAMFSQVSHSLNDTLTQQRWQSCHARGPSGATWGLVSDGTLTCRSTWDCTNFMTSRQPAQPPEPLPSHNYMGLIHFKRDFYSGNIHFQITPVSYSVSTSSVMRKKNLYLKAFYLLSHKKKQSTLGDDSSIMQDSSRYPDTLKHQ